MSSTFNIVSCVLQTPKPWRNASFAFVWELSSVTAGQGDFSRRLLLVCCCFYELFTSSSTLCSYFQQCTTVFCQCPLSLHRNHGAIIVEASLFFDSQPLLAKLPTRHRTSNIASCCLLLLSFLDLPLAEFVLCTGRQTRTSGRHPRTRTMDSGSTCHKRHFVVSRHSHE